MRPATRSRATAWRWSTRGAATSQAAWAAFSELLDQFPDYVPTYLMAGATLTALGRRDEAAEVYRRGIDVATRRGDPHARGELETALNETLNEPQSQT